MRRYAPATQRNREPILAVLSRVLPSDGVVLEVASGTGEHALYFSSQLPRVTWQPSDPDPANRASIEAWRHESALGNLRAPLDLDALAESWPLTQADALVNINMIHISPWAASEGLMRHAAELLPAGGVLYLYGPFMVDGRHTAPSNQAFDQMLRDQNPAWGVRDLTTVRALAEAHGLAFAETVAMPSNNLSVILRQR